MLKISAHAASMIEASADSDPKQPEWVQAAIKDRCTYNQIKHQAQAAAQPSAVNQGPAVALAGSYQD